MGKDGERFGAVDMEVQKPAFHSKGAIDRMRARGGCGAGCYSKRYSKRTNVLLVVATIIILILIGCVSVACASEETVEAVKGAVTVLFGF